MQKIPYGYVWFNGKVLCNAWTDSYNQYTSDIDRASREDTRNYLADNRHKFLVWCFSRINPVQ